MKLLRRASIGFTVACAALCALGPAWADEPPEPTEPVNCPAPAPVPTAARIKAALPTARDRGFLWQLQKDGRVSWLYGTVHLGGNGWGVPGPKVLAAYRASDLLALELDPTDPKQVAEMTERQAFKPLPPELDKRLRRLARANCLPDAVADVVPPSMLISVVMVFAARADGLDPANGTDLSLAVMARGDRRRIASLETVAQQKGALFGSGDADIEAFVASSIDQLESAATRPMLLRVATIWSESRFDELDDYANWCKCMDTDTDRALMRRMLDERNGPMADAIDRLHSDGRRVFAAVGSLHMIGPQGLPALLKARGYAVQRVPFETPAARP